MQNNAKHRCGKNPNTVHAVSSDSPTSVAGHVAIRITSHAISMAIARKHTTTKAGGIGPSTALSDLGCGLELPVFNIGATFERDVSSLTCRRKEAMRNLRQFGSGVSTWNRCRCPFCSFDTTILSCFESNGVINLGCGLEFLVCNTSDISLGIGTTFECDTNVRDSCRFRGCRSGLGFLISWATTCAFSTAHFEVCKSVFPASDLSTASTTSDS